MLEILAFPTNIDSIASSRKLHPSLMQGTTDVFVIAPFVPPPSVPPTQVAIIVESICTVSFGGR